jgi:hypothetical protein
MKRIFLLSILAVGLLAAYVALSVPEKGLTPQTIGTDQTLVQKVFPDAVHQILSTSCFDCHTSASQNEKAKAKLDFDKWSQMLISDRLAALDEICTEVTEGKMPTERYISNYPDRKLNADQVKTICTWTEEEAIKLIGE